MNNLGVAYRAAGRATESVKLLEGVRDARVALHGATYPSSLMAQYNLARSYRAVGRATDAVDLLEQVRDVCTTKYGADHIGTLTTLGELAATYLAVGRIADALELYAKVASLLELRQFQIRNAGEILTGAIAAFEEQGKLDTAAAWRRKWSSVVKSRSGPRTAEYARELSGLGGNLIRQRKWDDAERVLREALEIGMAAAPADWTTSIVQSLLGESQLSQKKYAEAEALLLKGYEGLKSNQNSIPPERIIRVSEALDRLIALYSITKKPDEVKKYRALRAKYPPELAPPPRAVK